MDSTNEITTRHFARDDVEQLLELMRGLARFEGYIDQFRVTENDLVQYGLGPASRFDAFVAQERGAGPLLGTAVMYVIPWTYDLRPTLILKELYVDASARGRGVGEALMRRVAARAVELECPRVGWTVLKTNTRGASFYRRLGAAHDQVWDSWALDEASISSLAGEVK